MPRFCMTPSTFLLPTDTTSMCTSKRSATSVAIRVTNLYVHLGSANYQNMRLTNVLKVHELRPLLRGPQELAVVQRQCDEHGRQRRARSSLQGRFPVGTHSQYHQIG